MKPSKVAVTASGSMLSALLSFLPLTCCVFPVAFSFLGAGGLALAMDMMQYRPHFIALTQAFLAAGFYFAYRPEQNRVCARRGLRHTEEPKAATGKLMGSDDIDACADRFPLSHSVSADRIVRTRAEPFIKKRLL